MSRPTPAWFSLFDACLERGDLDGAIHCLDGLRTAHAGTAPQKVKHAAIARIQKAYGPDGGRTRDAGLVLTMSDDPTAKEIGISLLPPVSASAPEEIDARFLRTGDDPNWEVREWAASALAHVISGHVDQVHPRLREWTANPSPNVRRMVVVAAGYAMRDCTAAQCRRLLDLLTSVMADTDSYVSKNLGPFALGSYAIRYQPELLAQWAIHLNLADEQVAWNLAMVFTTAEGAKRAMHFSGLLEQLERDERRRVQSAVRKATANLSKRNSAALSFLAPDEDS